MPSPEYTEGKHWTMMINSFDHLVNLCLHDSVILVNALSEASLNKSITSMTIDHGARIWIDAWCPDHLFLSRVIKDFWLS